QRGGTGEMDASINGAGIGDGVVDAAFGAEEEAFAFGGLLGGFVDDEGVVGAGGFVPASVERGAVGVDAAVGGENAAVGVKDEMVFVGMAVAAAVGAVFEAEPGGLGVGALLEHGVAGGGGVAAGGGGKLFGFGGARGFGCSCAGGGEVGFTE